MRSGAPYVLAIDLGTTGVKVAVVDDDGAIRCAAAESFATRFTPEGAAEQDAEVWWQAIGRCSRAAVAGAGDADAIAAVAVTAQYMSVVAIDEQGMPLAPVVMWMDTRGGPRHPLRDDHDAFGLWVERHGLPPLPNDDLAHIAVLRAFYPEVDRSVAAFVEPVDAVVARLSGRIVATATTAFPLMCTDNRVWSRVAYDPELVARGRRRRAAAAHRRERRTGRSGHRGSRGASGYQRRRVGAPGHGRLDHVGDRRRRARDVARRARCRNHIGDRHARRREGGRSRARHLEHSEPVVGALFRDGRERRRRPRARGVAAPGRVRRRRHEHGCHSRRRVRARGSSRGGHGARGRGSAVPPVARGIGCAGTRRPRARRLRRNGSGVDART